MYGRVWIKDGAWVFENSVGQLYSLDRNSEGSLKFGHNENRRAFVEKISDGKVSIVSFC
jgi:hypothetical protein